MKTAFVCDTLIERNLAVDLLEKMLNDFPEATIYTSAFNPKNVFGPIQHHPIRSTYLSRFMKDSQNFYRYAFLAPGAIKNLKIDEDVDIVFSITNGLSHAIEVPSRARHINLNLGKIPFDNAKKGLGHKIFKSYLEKFNEKEKSKLKETYNIGDFYPPINTAEFAPRTANEFLKLDYYLFDPVGLSKNKISKIVNTFRKLKTKVKVLIDLPDFDNNCEFVEYWGKRCDGELAPLAENCRALIFLGEDSSNYNMAKVLASGRPIILKNTTKWRSIFSDKAGIYVNSSRAIDLESAIKEMDHTYANYKRQELRACALKFSTSKFNKWFNEVISSKQLV